MNITKYSITLIFLLNALKGCALFPVSTMSGNWLLQLNSGEEFTVSINQVDLNNIFINADEVHISGRYSLANNRLTLIKANQPRITGVEFIGKDEDSWVMVKAPPAGRVGHQLSGSSLTKIGM